MDNLTKDFETFAKRSKRKRWLKIIGLIVVISILVVFAVLKGISWYSNNASSTYQTTVKNANLMNEIAAPNISIKNQIEESDGLFSKTLHSDTTKNLDGIEVPWTPQDLNVDLTDVKGNNSLYTKGSDAYTQKTSQKQALFFPSKITVPENFDNITSSWAKHPTHEAASLSALTNQVAEVAVSFDKPYSYAEIQTMIPKNLLINWYEVNLDVTKSGTPTIVYGLSADSKGDSIAADGTNFVSANTTTGLLTESDYKNFLSALTNSQQPPIMQNVNGVNSGNYPNYAKHYASDYPTLAKAKFSGVILTGRTQNFATLDKEKWVYATNVGLTAPIMPWDKLTK